MPIKDNLNFKTIEEIKKFETKVNDLGGQFMISFPGFQVDSYELIEDKIKEVHAVLKKENFVILGRPKRYTFPDSLMFDSPYHLIKSGVDLRTNYLIEDITHARQNLKDQNK